eukprot:678155-Pelagomonas_calceolata.AAC.3
MAVPHQPPGLFTPILGNDILVAQGLQFTRNYPIRCRSATEGPKGLKNVCYGTPTQRASKKRGKFMPQGTPSDLLPTQMMHLVMANCAPTSWLKPVYWSSL